MATEISPKMRSSTGTAQVKTAVAGVSSMSSLPTAAPTTPETNHEPAAPFFEASGHWLPSARPVPVGKTMHEAGEAETTITCVACHPTIDLFALGSADGNLVAWDPLGGIATARMKAHQRDVSQALFTHQGDRYVTGSTDGYIHVWRAGELIGKVNVGSAVHTAALSPSGRELAVGCVDQVLRILDFDTLTVLVKFEPQLDPVSSCCWLGPRQLVTGGMNGYLYGWEVDNGECVWRSRGHDQLVSDLVLLDDHSFLSASWDQKIRVYSLKYKHRFDLPTADQPITKTCQIDRHLVAASHWDGKIRIWNLKKAELHDEFVAFPDGGLVGLALFEQGESLAAISQQGSIRVFKAQEFGKVTYLHRHSSEVYDICFLKSTPTIITVGHDATLKEWDATERQQCRSFVCHHGPTTAYAISEDHRRQAIGGANGEIRLWDEEDQAFSIPLAGHGDVVTSLHFSPSGHELVSTSWDYKTIIWSVQERDLAYQFETLGRELADSDWSLDGRWLATASWDKSVRIWDMNARRQARQEPIRVLEDHQGAVLTCRFHPAGSLVATGASDGIVRIWDLEKITDPCLLQGHSGQLACLRFTPDGQRLITADRMGLIRVWDTGTWELTQELRHDSAVLTMAVAPSGSEVAVGDEAGFVRFFRLEYGPQPAWTPTRRIIKKNNIWNFGAPPSEAPEWTCARCETTKQLPIAKLGQLHRCSCGHAVQLCPKMMI